MSGSDSPFESSLLNIFEVSMNGETRQLLCFLEPGDLGEDGISPEAIVGELHPDDDSEEDQEFDLNPAFVQALVEFMNHEAIYSEGLIDQAKQAGKGWLYLLDPRNATPPDQEPPVGDLLGAFAVGEDGTIVPDSFQYNEQHLFFDPVHGQSGIFSDQRFYDWLHEEVA